MVKDTSWRELLSYFADTRSSVQERRIKDVPLTNGSTDERTETYLKSNVKQMKQRSDKNTRQAAILNI
jgi:hypothetical protein